MNIIDEITIEGLWGENRAFLKLHPDINFVIGPNGSGKTTIINLVVAALTADLRPLLHVPFDRVVIKLKEVSGPKKPIVQLDKEVREGSGGRVSIRYQVKESSTSRSDEFLLEDMEDYYNFKYPARRRFTHRIEPSLHGLQHRLSTLFNLTWLSIHRARPFRHQDEEDSYDSSVDSKLAELGNEFVRFFSELSQMASLEMKQFQTTVFLSLLVEPNEDSVRDFRRMDLEAEKRDLIDIYKELEVPPRTIEKRVESHFEHVKHAFDRLESDHQLDTKDFAILITNIRTHQIVKKWNKVTEKQAEIYEPREAFLHIINELMPKKKFSLNAKNELAVTVNSGRQLRLHDLSSGEKQMLIILGEAILQRGAPAIYVADEPELSLHVEWQEALVDNVRKLNAKAQILFATHSPDIVGRFCEKVHDVREILS